MLNQEMRTVTMNRSDMLRVAQALTHVVLGFRDEVRAATTEDRRRSAKCSPPRIWPGRSPHGLSDGPDPGR